MLRESLLLVALFVISSFLDMPYGAWSVLLRNRGIKNMLTLFISTVYYYIGFIGLLAYKYSFEWVAILCGIVCVYNLIKIKQNIFTGLVIVAIIVSTSFLIFSHEPFITKVLLGVCVAKSVTDFIGVVVLIIPAFKHQDDSPEVERMVTSYIYTVTLCAVLAYYLIWS